MRVTIDRGLGGYSAVVGGKPLYYFCCFWFSVKRLGFASIFRLGSGALVPGGGHQWRGSGQGTASSVATLPLFTTLYFPHREESDYRIHFISCEAAAVTPQYESRCIHYNDKYINSLEHSSLLIMELIYLRGLICRGY
jgi:hypothetical protein